MVIYTMFLIYFQQCSWSVCWYARYLLTHFKKRTTAWTMERMCTGKYCFGPFFFLTVFIEYFRNFKIKPFDFGLDNFGIVFTNSIFSILQYFENLIRLLTSFFTTQFVIDQVFSILTLYST